MLRLQFSIGLDYQVSDPGCDFIFSIHAAQTAHQKVVNEKLTISQPVQSTVYTDPATHSRYLRFGAKGGPLAVHYEATLDLEHFTALPQDINEVPVGKLPGAVLPYLYPSRYCPSDRLHRLALKEFGDLPKGYSRVAAIHEWVTQRVSFQSNTSNGSTTAIDTLVDRVGVCRDFTHLMIALCRALNMPARFSTGTDFGADPALGPPDFHAYVEVYLSHRWYIFDPSGTAIPLGFIRIGTGRDATDVSIATIFGSVQSAQPVISVAADPGPHGQYMLPTASVYGISTA